MQELHSHKQLFNKQQQAPLLITDNYILFLQYGPDQLKTVSIGASKRPEIS